MSVIIVDDAELQQKLDNAESRLANTSILMRAIASTLHDVTERNFEAQGRPRWAGRRPNYHNFTALDSAAGSQFAGLKPKRAGSTNLILQRTGQLAGSITPFHSRNAAGLGTNKVYAAIHQFGGTTKAHVIRPVNKKALSFNGMVRKSVNHPGSKIPARPYMPMDKNGNLQKEARDEINHDIDDYMQQSF